MSKQQYFEIKQQLAALETEFQRPAGRVKLLAVSKTFPVPDIQEVYDAGQREFGENRPQELAAKVPLLPSDCIWHLIGQLQQNKVRLAVQYAQWIHSVDSLALLKRINTIAAELGKAPKLLFEVNISGEASKSGLRASELPELLEEAKKGPAVPVGLMTMAPFAASEDVLRAVFNGLRDLRDTVSRQCKLELPELSMGMSGDFPTAVACGSTIVRIGTAIFGHR